MSLRTRLAAVLGIEPSLYTPHEAAVARAESALAGLSVDPVEPIAWDADMNEVDPPARDDDDAVDDFTDSGGLVLWPEDLPEPPTLDDRAERIAHDLAQVYATPGPWHPRRWTVVARWNNAVRSLGIGPVIGTGTLFDWSGQRANGPVRWIWPVYRQRWTCDGRPRVSWRARTIAGRSGWWWECLARQIRAKSWPLHRPLTPVAMGICAACAPCPTCHQPYCDDEYACLHGAHR